MFKNNHLTNICGKNVYSLRCKSSPCMSQRMFAERLGQAGIDLDKNVIQRIESGQRFVKDIELVAIAGVFGVTVQELTRQ